MTDQVNGRWFWSPSLGAEDISAGLVEMDGDEALQSIHGEWRLLPEGVPHDAVPLIMDTQDTTRHWQEDRRP